MTDDLVPETGSVPGTGDFLRRLKWLFGLRLAVAVLGMFTVLVREPGGVEFPSRYLTAYSALGLLCVASLVWLVTFRRARDPRRHVAMQFTVDVALVSLLVYATGGVQSVFAFLYFAIVVGAAVLLTTRTAFFLASLATVFLSATTVVYYLGAHFQFQLPLLKRGLDPIFTSDVSFVLPYLVFFSLSLYLVAWLAGRLATELIRVRIVHEEILENISGGVLAVGVDGRVAVLNDQVRRLLGVPAELRESEQVLGWLLHEPALDPIGALVRTPREGSVDLVLPPLDGRFRAVNATTSLLRGEQGQVRGVILFLDDAADRRLLEEAHRKSLRMEASSEMAATIAHEIRNPLASIRGAIQELSDGLPLGEEDRRLMGVVLRESDRLNGIITRFLEFSRLRAPEFQPVDLSALLREGVLLMEKRDTDKRLKYAIELPDVLHVQGDADLLRQVFLNLLINAAEASPVGGTVTVRGRVASIRRPLSGRVPVRGVAGGIEGVQIEISDQGAGVAAQALPRIFDPFFTTKPRGTGMGLAVAHKILMAHHGQINVENLARAGARFTVWLPVRPAAAAAPPGPANQAPAAGSPM